MSSFVKPFEEGEIFLVLSETSKANGCLVTAKQFKKGKWINYVDDAYYLSKNQFTDIITGKGAVSKAGSHKHFIVLRKLPKKA